MSKTVESKKHPEPDEYLKAVIAGSRAFEWLKDGRDESRQVAARMDKERLALTEKYPDQWVAVGKDGLLAVSVSAVEVLEAVESMGLCGSEFVVEFLDSDPQEDLIL